VGEKVIQWIKSKELEAPATIFVEMHRPLQPLAWTAAMLAGPFLAPLIGPDYYKQIEALKDPKIIDRILRRLRDSENDEGKD